MCSPSTSFLGPSDQGNLLLVAPVESVMNKHARARPMGIICSKMLEHGWSQSQLRPGHSAICQHYSYTVTTVIPTLSSFCPFFLWCYAHQQPPSEVLRMVDLRWIKASRSHRNTSFLRENMRLIVMVPSPQSWISLGSFSSISYIFLHLELICDSVLHTN